MSWLFCSAHLSAGLRVTLVCLLFLIFTCLVYSGFFLWKFYQNREKEPYSKKIVWIAALFIFLASLVVPFASGDVVFYFYAGKAEHAGTDMFVQEWNRENHFVQPPAKLNDKFPYGPVTARVFGALYAISHDNVVIFILLWKVVVGLFFFLLGWLLWKFLDTSSNAVEKNNLWLLWLLQPAALFEWMVSGHFDAIWLVFILIALIFAQRKKWWLVLPCLFIGIWIKFIPIFFVPWFVVKWWQDIDGQNWKKMLGGQLAGILISAIITVLAWGTFWRGFIVFDTISKLSKWAVSSTFAVLYYTLAPLFNFLIGVNYHWYLTRFVQFGLLSVVLYFMYPFIKKSLLVIFRRAVLSEVDFLNAFFVSMVVYMIFWQKAVWPWYTTWLLPLGIMAYIKSKNEYIKKITAWITISPLFFYFVWMLNFQITNGGDATMHLWFFYYVVISVFVYPSYYLYKWRMVNYNIEDSIAASGKSVKE
ncbi:MAG: hypothetical protein KBC69_02820 [Candidatus Magasanikbacteria bacterium]|nr:hypothetical protein [Candidatus Magasanikbacteria bacterium]